MNDMHTAEPTVDTEVEAARFLKIARRTLVTLRQQGAVPFFRIGRGIRYDRRDLMAHLKRCAPKAGGWR
ncbi:MAG: helix-turn-helix domain-containing protein [Verrucomicrobiae bacterium]|nr:helix-turn-helix domain-containing protein [Verrucomicrobiae bacterium]